MSYFAGDLVATHIILFAQIPILLIPYADKWHTLMLFWLKPGNQIRPRILSNVKTKKKISGKLVLAHLLLGLILFSSIFVLPLIATKYFDIEFSEYIQSFSSIVSTYDAPTNLKGLKKN